MGKAWENRICAFLYAPPAPLFSHQTRDRTKTEAEFVYYLPSNDDGESLSCLLQSSRLLFFCKRLSSWMFFRLKSSLCQHRILFWHLNAICSFAVFELELGPNSPRQLPASASFSPTHMRSSAKEEEEKKRRSWQRSI